MGYGGHKRKPNAPGYIITPVLTEDWIEMEALSTEELLKDIRSFRQVSSKNKINVVEED